MSEERIYIPKKGDIVWIDFDPSVGKEIQKRRPGLVVSRYVKQCFRSYVQLLPL